MRKKSCSPWSFFVVEGREKKISSSFDEKKLKLNNMQKNEEYKYLSPGMI